ncbi:histidine kinase [Herbaspirillum sp. meg3]|jgi:HD-like signal output (HDOD) protein|uniref:HDOD domain-containing protein n=1 Tax=Herbaspirillum sp. meg3 TaxID=2025949 RepID=UPI000B99AE08|nr:HDOD domain-containing protein [Herbaspirillum sp. meg3]ASU38665.1 histidine kinase [Herbaspirillum sp. meg3]
MNRLEAFRSIAAQAGRGELVFPTNVNASIKLQQALNDPNCHLEAAAKLVMAEPLLSARTVAIANSAAYNRSGGEINNVRTAVMRLGFKTLNAITTAVIVRQLGRNISDAEMRVKAAQLWEHTANVAAIAQVIALKMTRLDPETAMFAGIVHEVGGFYLLSRTDEFPGLLDGNSEDWAEYGEKMIGRAVLKKLGIPEAVVAAVESLWHGIRVLPPETLGDVLLLAKELSPVPSPFQKSLLEAGRAPDTIVDEFIGDDSLRDMLEDSADEIRSLTQALLI